MDSDSVNRALDRVRERLRDWVLSGTSEGAERRRSALGRLVKAFFVPCVLVLLGGSIFLSKRGTELGLQNEAPHKLLGTLEETYANTNSVESGSAAVVVDKTVKDLGEELVKKTEPKKLAVPEQTPTPVSAILIEETPLPAVTQVPNPTASAESSQQDKALTVKPESGSSSSLGSNQKTVPAPKAFLRRSVFPATFGFGKANPILLTEDLELFRLIIKGCSGTIVIEGHSDGLGTPARNDNLSRSRAAAVSQLLLSRGLLAERQRYEAISMGGTRPVADDSTEEGRAANRRVEIWCRD